MGILPQPPENLSKCSCKSFSLPAVHGSALLLGNEAGQVNLESTIFCFHGYLRLTLRLRSRRPMASSSLANCSAGIISSS